MKTKIKPEAPLSAGPQRPSKRGPAQLRPVKIIVDYVDFADGSAYIEMGRTRVLATATIDERVPPFLRGTGSGWVTAEYSMLPRATRERTPRERVGGKISGRTQEIQRLIGRSLRAVTDLRALGERQIIIDCDVLQADGGTRCASICGAYVAASRALEHFGLSRVLTDSVAAVSVGIVAGEKLLDLDYAEDSQAEVDMNYVMTGAGHLIEVQATAETAPFSREELDDLLALATRGVELIGVAQQEALRSAAS